MFPSPNSQNPFDSLSSFPPSSPTFDYSKPQDQNPLFLFNLPTPYFDEDSLPLNQIFFQTHDLMPQDHHKTAHDPTKESPESTKTIKTDQVPVPGIVRRRNLVPRRRTGKKDRHSKICTAQGIRDRRMRLSLQVARKFFDLQDMLGYDKASKTIEWLFTKSKKAIKELTKGCNPNGNKLSIGGDPKTEYFLSECEVVTNNKIGAEQQDLDVNIDERKSQNKIRESRDKARARARSRAKEKMIIKNFEELGQGYKQNPNFQKLGFPNIQFEAGDQQQNSHNQDRVSLSSAGFSSHELSNLGTIEKLLGNSSSSMSTPCPLSDYVCSSGAYVDPDNLMGFSENWDALNGDKMNSVQSYLFMNQVQMADNLNSIHLATANFP